MHEARLAAFAGLGQIHFVAGHWAEAEAWLRQADRLGRQMNVLPALLARLYFWLGDVLFWQMRLDEMVALGEEGLRLFGEGESVKTALMYSLISWGKFVNDSAARWQYVAYLADVLPRLPYCEELRPAYQFVANYCRWHVRDREAGERWGSLMVEQTRQHHDLRAQVSGLYHQGNMQIELGDSRAAAALLHQAAVLAVRIGDVPSMIMVADACDSIALLHGEIEQSEGVIARLFGELDAPVGGYRTCSPYSRPHAGSVWASAVRSRRARREIAGCLPLLPPNRRGDFAEWLGRMAWALGERAEALRWYQEALLTVHPDAANEPISTWWPSNRPRFVSVLGGLEAACADADEFRAFCRRCQETGIAGPAGLQWRLEPALGVALEPAARRAPGYAAEFVGRTMAEWLAAGCGVARSVGRLHRGHAQWSGRRLLILEAANGRDLYWINYNAPRLVRPATGNLIVEAICSTAYHDRPAMGGVLLWRDPDHYLRLDWARGGSVLEIAIPHHQIIGFLDGIPSRVHVECARVPEACDVLL